MQVITTAAEVADYRARLRGVLGLVPTMGALHAGHEALLRRSTGECAHTAISIFVNPKQFNDAGDLAAYPVDVERDLDMARRLGVDLAWTPPPEEVYPPGFQTQVEVSPLGGRVEGAARPGHFRGVATVVAKLLVLFRPQRAYFGQKDAQQLAVVRRLATDLNTGVDIVACPTVREADGLALSSRNVLLDAAARALAPALYRGLRAAEQAWAGGERRRETLLALVRSPVAATSIELEYVSLADAQTMEELDDEALAGACEPLLSLAARAGGVRLIDNVPLPAVATPAAAAAGGSVTRARDAEAAAAAGAS